MEPFALSAADARTRIVDGELSSVALVESCLGRIRQLEPELQAWERVDATGSLATAGQRDAEAAAGRIRGPLHGIPVGVKDLYDVAGLPTTAGSPIRARFPLAAQDATLVARLKRAGGIVLGKTVTTEWAASDTPRTRNPWNRAHIPGGSSSGSAVAVAAGMCPAALGTQTAGSIVRPAAYTGVVGFKPSYGLLSRHGMVPASWSIDTPGVLVRTVQDAALLLDVLAESDPRDASPPTPPRLGVVERFVAQGSEVVKANMAEVLRRLEDAGAELVTVAPPDNLDAVLAAHWTILQVDAAAYHEQLYQQHHDEYGPNIRAFIETGQLVPAVAYVQSLRIRRGFLRVADGMLGGCDALILPTTGEAAPASGQVGGERRPMSDTGDPAFQMPWTFAGLPVISLPSGLTAERLPLAVQLVGARYDDRRLLATAEWCQHVLGPFPFTWT